jgi:hypothetical protein
MFILILTATARLKDGGVSIASIEFNTAAAAYEAASKWMEANKNNVIATYLVVEK